MNSFNKLYISAVLCILTFGSSSLAQDKKNYEDIFLVEIDVNNSLNVAEESSSKGTLDKYDGVIYIYTDAKYVRFSMKEGVEKEVPGIKVEADGADFNGCFYKSDLSKMNGKSDCIYRTSNKNSMVTVGLNDGGYPGIKLKTGGQEMHIRRPDGEDWKPSFSEVSLNVELNGPDGTSVRKTITRTDTIRLEQGQTIRTLSFKKPKFTTVEKLRYISAKGINLKIPDQMGGKNGPYDVESIVIRPNISAEDLASCESIALDFVVLDSIGVRQQIETVCFPVKFEDVENCGTAWKWVVIGALIVAFAAAIYLCFSVSKDKIKPGKEKVEDSKKEGDTEDSSMQKEAEDKYDELCGKLEQMLEKLKTYLDSENQKEELNSIINELKVKLAVAENALAEAESSAEELRKELESAKNDVKNNADKYDKSLNALIKDYKTLIEDYKSIYSDIITKRDEAVSKKDAEIAAIKQELSIDRSVIKNFYIQKLDAVKTLIDKVENSSDPDSAVYPLIEKIAKSITGISSFYDNCRDVVKADSSIKTIVEEVKKTLVGDLDYDQSWCNNLARVYAYSRTDNEDFKEIFGYSGSYKQEIEKAFNEMKSLAEVFGITGITVPEILMEPFDDNRYDFRNDSSIIIKIYPGTSGLIRSGYIFDIIKVGYTDSGRQTKATVAYYL